MGLLVLVNAVSSSSQDLLSHRGLAAAKWTAEHASETLIIHQKCFDAGLVSVQSVVDILVRPFMKLAKCENQGSSPTPVLVQLRKHLLFSWYKAIMLLLDHSPVLEASGDVRMVPYMGADKHAELLRALKTPATFRVCIIPWLLLHPHLSFY